MDPFIVSANQALYPNARQIRLIAHANNGTTNAIDLWWLYMYIYVAMKYKIGYFSSDNPPSCQLSFALDIQLAYNRNMK